MKHKKKIIVIVIVLAVLVIGIITGVLYKKVLIRPLKRFRLFWLSGMTEMLNILFAK